MTTDLATRPEHGAALRPTEAFGEMTVQALIDRKRKILEVMNAVMKEGPNGHYGTIPGCGDKPTLYKSGAEVLATTFGLAPRFVVIQTDLPGGHREYRVTCTLAHIASGANCGEGVGSCSTLESKYRYRGGSRKCPKCGKETIIKGKEEYGGGWLCFGKKGGCGAKWPNGAAEIEKQETGKVENPDPADQYNTVLKMAKKRAQVDATLTAVGASDLLTQDLEDLPPASEVVVPATVTTTNGNGDPARNGFNRKGTEARIAQALKQADIEPIVRATIEKLGHKGKSLKTLTDEQVRDLDFAIDAAVNDASGANDESPPS